MKGFFIKISSLFLVFLTLSSTFIIVVDAHHCSGKIVDISFFGQADVCKMDMISCETENTSTSKILGSCCYNSNSIVYAKDFKKTDLTNVDFTQFNFIPSFNLVSTSDLFIELEISNVYYKEYEPPLITRDILILVQSFLI